MYFAERVEHCSQYSLKKDGKSLSAKCTMLDFLRQHHLRRGGRQLAGRKQKANQYSPSHRVPDEESRSLNRHTLAVSRLCRYWRNIWRVCG